MLRRGDGFIGFIGFNWLRVLSVRSHNEEDQIDNSYAKKKYFSELFFTGTLLVVIGVPRKQGVRVPKSAERAQRVFGNSSIAR